MDYINGKNIVIHEEEWQKYKVNTNKIVLPIYGNISCGQLKSIDNNLEGYLEIPKRLIGNGDYFVLRTSGDSMVEADIHDGNLIIIKRQSTAENGDIVAVMVDNDVTLKRFFKLEDIQKYKLHPENSNYDDIIVDNCDILGIAVKILKNL